jgi:hypothetical protein
MSKISQSTLLLSSSSSLAKRRITSVAKTHFIAHTARGKLVSEAARGDHDLRLLIGHANLLDLLLFELEKARQEQENWFNQSVKKATQTKEPRHIQRAESIVVDFEEDWQVEGADSSDSESDDSDDDLEFLLEVEDQNNKGGSRGPTITSCSITLGKPSRAYQSNMRVASAE